MDKKIKNLMFYVISDFNRDTQGLKVDDEVYENFKNPDHEAYEDFDILWEECREVDIRGDMVTYSGSDLDSEEAIRVINSEARKISAIGMEVDIEFYNGKKLIRLEPETAKEEIKKEENYYPIKIEVKDCKTRYFIGPKDATEWLVSEYCYNSEVVPGEMLARTTITGCSVEIVLDIAKNFLEVTD